MPRPFSLRVDRQSYWLFPLVLIAYLAGAKLAFHLLSVSGLGAAMFLPAGVTLGTLLLTNVRMWPVVLAAAATAEVGLDLTEGLSAFSTSAIAAANVIEPFVGAVLIRQSCGGRPDLARLAHLVRFLAFGVVTGPCVGAAIGALSVRISSGRSWPVTFAHWWVGDGIGALLVGGTLLAWSATSARSRVSREAVIVAASTVGVTLAISFATDRPVYFLWLPLLMWSAFRFDVFFVAAIGTTSAVIMVAAAANGYGYWNTFASDGVVYLQAFLGTAFVASLLLTAASSERDRATRGQQSAEVAQAISERDAHWSHGHEQLALALSAAAEIESVASALLTHGLPLINAQAGEVHLVDGRTGSLHPVGFPAGTAERLNPLTPSQRLAARGGRVTEADNGRELALPLQAQGRVIGLLNVRTDGQEGFKPEERLAARAVADRGAEALQRASLFEAERVARGRAESLERLADRLGAANSPDDVAQVVVDTGRELGLHVEFAHNRDDDQDYGERKQTTSEPMEVELTAGSTLPLTLAASGTGERIVVSTDAERRQRFPNGVTSSMTAFPIGSFCAIPVRTGGTTVGAVLVGYPEEYRASDPTTQASATTAAELIGQALGRTFALQRERDIARRLQRALLPRTLVQPDGVQVAVIYRPGESDLQVGGDWYDVLQLPSRRIAAVVGDVVGRGIDSAIVMGQLRSGLGAIVPFSAGPVDVLERLDQFADGVEGARMSTLCYFELDPEAGALTYALAGHPPLVLVEPDGSCRLLEGGHSGPLVVTPTPRIAAQETLPAGSLILAYTDGLVERRGESLDDGFRRLMDSAATHRHLDLEAFVAAVVAELTDGQPRHDDLVLLAVRTLRK